MRWRFLTVLPAAATALVLGAGTASAHECFNASRSQQGNQAAGTHSQAWTTLDSLARSFLPAEQADCVLGELAAAGISTTTAVHVKGANGQDGVIAEHNPHDEKHGDGSGIDHLFDAYGPAFGAAFAACGVPLDG
jgi:hypothetical protein